MKRYQNKLRSKKSKAKVRLSGKYLPQVELDMKELTVSINGRGSELIFLTKVYESGHVLGFYSHSPWGRVRNQEQGWKLIDTQTLEIVEEVETRACGLSTGEFTKWYKRIGETYGKSQYLLIDGERKWKITDSE